MAHRYEALAWSQALAWPVLFAILTGQTAHSQTCSLTLGPPVQFDTPITWTPSGCTATVRGYENGRLVGQVKQTRSGEVTIGQIATGTSAALRVNLSPLSGTPMETPVVIDDCSAPRFAISSVPSPATPVCWVLPNCTATVEALQDGAVVSRFNGVKSCEKTISELTNGHVKPTELRIYPTPASTAPAESRLVEPSTSTPAVLRRFQDDFRQNKGWLDFITEEIVDDRFYNTGAARVALSSDLAPSAPRTLRTEANWRGWNYSNHVIAGNRIVDSGQTGRWIYRFSFYLPSATAGSGQTGPEGSIQNTVDGTHTYIAGLQFQSNPESLQENRDAWAIWMRGGWVVMAHQAIVRDRWYTAELEADFESKEYVRFSVTGDGFELRQELAGQPIAAESRGFDPAFVLTLEVENQSTSDAPRPTNNVVYYRDVELVRLSELATSDPLRFVPGTPCRVAETRPEYGGTGGPLPGNSVRDFPVAGVCGIPAEAKAYSLNVTIVPKGALGYLTLWPAGATQPYVSTMNSDDRIKANAAIVPAGIGGAVSVYVTDESHVILDINGYFTATPAANALALYLQDPCRVVETDPPAGPFGGPHMSAGETRSFPFGASPCGFPLGAKAYSLNVTVAPMTPLSYLTTWPSTLPRPPVSTLNAPTGIPTANAAIVPAGPDRGVQVYVTEGTRLVVDRNGYFAAPGGPQQQFFRPLAPCRVLDTREPGQGPILDGERQVAFAGRCGIPSTAEAVVLNATVVPAGPLGYLTLWPAGGARPIVSTLNASDGVITSNMAIVPLKDGSLSMFSAGRTHVILDVSGYFAPIAPWGIAVGDKRVDAILDVFDSPWTVCSTPDPSSIHCPIVRTVEVGNGNAMEVEYDLTNIAGPNSEHPGESWVVVQRRLSTDEGDFRRFTHLRVALKGSNPKSHDNVELKLAGGQGLFTASLKSMTDLPVWRTIYIDLREFIKDGRAIDQANLANIVGLEIAIVRCDGCEDFDNPSMGGPQEEHTGTLSIRELAAVDLKPGAVNRLVESGCETVEPNQTIPGETANALLARIVPAGPGAGLIPAWFPQIPPNFDSYAQAQALLVFTYEYERTRNVAFLNAARNLATKLLGLQAPPGTAHAGAWYTGSSSQDGVLTSVGNVGWLLIALERLQHSGLYHDPDSLRTALARGAAWVAGQRPDPEHPDLVSTGTEGNISAYFGLFAAGRRDDAARLGNAILTRAWDDVQLRLKPGVHPFNAATAMDVAGSWGVTFLRAIGEWQKALDSQSYAASILRVCSFDRSICGYGDIAGPYTPAVEFTAQAAAAGIKDANFVMREILKLQRGANDPYSKAFPGAANHWYGGQLPPWNTTMPGVSPTAWVYFALGDRDPLVDILKRHVGPSPCRLP